MTHKGFLFYLISMVCHFLSLLGCTLYAIGKVDYINTIKQADKKLSESSDKILTLHNIRS